MISNGSSNNTKNKKLKEIVDEYSSTLKDLNIENCKPMIHVLTELAGDNIEYAPSIVHVVEVHLQKVGKDMKLIVLYLIDCIIKNLGGTYISLFKKNLVSSFRSAFERVDETTKLKLWKLRKSWTNVFPKEKLLALDVHIHNIDRGWPIIGAPLNSTSSKNVNTDPSFTSLRQHQEKKSYPETNQSIDNKTLPAKKDNLLVKNVNNIPNFDTHDISNNKKNLSENEKAKDVNSNQNNKKDLNIQLNSNDKISQNNIEKCLEPQVTNSNSNVKFLKSISTSSPSKKLPTVVPSSASASKSIKTQSLKNLSMSVPSSRKLETKSSSNKSVNSPSKKLKLDSSNAQISSLPLPSLIPHKTSSKSSSSESVSSLSPTKSSSGKNDASPLSSSYRIPKHSMNSENNKFENRIKNGLQESRNAMANSKESSENIILNDTENSNEDVQSMTESAAAATYKNKDIKVTLLAVADTSMEAIKDTDLRIFPSITAKRKSPDLLESSSKKKSKAEKLDELFGSDDFDSRTLNNSKAEKPQANVPLHNVCEDFKDSCVKLKSLNKNDRKRRSSSENKPPSDKNRGNLERSGLCSKSSDQTDRTRGPLRDFDKNERMRSRSRNGRRWKQPWILRPPGPPFHGPIQCPFPGPFGPDFRPFGPRQNRPPFRLMRPGYGFFKPKQMRPNGPIKLPNALNPECMMPFPSNLAVDPMSLCNTLTNEKLSSLVTPGVSCNSDNSKDNLNSFKNEAAENKEIPLTSSGLTSDLNQLIQRLVEIGMVPNLLENKKEEAEEKKELEITPVTFDKPDTIKTKQPTQYTKLYIGTQCSSCGLRFPAELAQKYIFHLDWHYRENRRERDSAKKALSRPWYFDIRDWSLYEENEDLEDRKKSWFETENVAKEDTLVELSQPSVPCGNEHEDSKCQVCHDDFEHFFNEEKDEWHYKSAVKFEGKNFHPLCLEDHKKALEKLAKEETLDDLKTKNEIHEEIGETNENEHGKMEVDEKIENECEETDNKEEITEAENFTKEKNTDLVCKADDTMVHDEEEVMLILEPEQTKKMPIIEEIIDDDDYNERILREEGSEEIKQGNRSASPIIYDESVKIKEEPIDEADSEEIPMSKAALVDTTKVEVKSTIDGNVELNTAEPGIPASVSKLIKINISKPLPDSTKEIREIKEKENNNKELLKEQGIQRFLLPKSIKPDLQCKKLSNLQCVQKGEELSGFCSIM